MSDVLKIMYEFIFLFILFLMVYFIFINKTRKEYTSLRENDSVRLFIAKNNLDMRKTNYIKVLNTLSIINSFILAFGTTIVIYINGRLLSILIAFAVIIILIYSSYELAGRYFRKKEDEKNV